MNRHQILIETIDRLIKEHQLIDQVTGKLSPTGYYIWLRKIDKWRRHLWIRELSAPPVEIWEYGGVWGFYPAWEEEIDESDKGKGFDSRTMGDLDFMLKFFQAWIIDWVDWRQLPSYSDEFDKWSKEKSKSEKS